MRLIDAGALITRLYEYTEEHTYIDDDGDVIIPDFPPWIHIEIANFPTIEAIPIEWIIKWNEDYAPKDYREMTEDMIADWREEQSDE